MKTRANQAKPGPADLNTGNQPVFDETDAHEFDPGPISGHQHDLESGEPRTDSATASHPVGDPSAAGGQDFRGYGGAEGNEGA
jgi:hypothetical protein